MDGRARGRSPNRRGEAVIPAIFDSVNTSQIDTNGCQRPAAASPDPEPPEGNPDGAGDAVRADARWHALWTRSHCERVVWDGLTAKGFHAFLPTIDVWSSRAGARHRIQVPMFPGYLFLNHPMDKTAYTEVRKTRGLVCFLGEGWDNLAVVPPREIEAIQKVVQSRTSVFPHAYLRAGQRVRITRGPLADVEGVLVQQKPDKGLLVLSIAMLRRSIAVEVDCTWIVAA